MAGVKPSVKVGDIFETNSYGSCKVIKYEGRNKVTVRFLETGAEVITQGSSLKRGSVKDPLHPSVCGVGFTGGVGTRVNGKNHRSYEVWYGILKRCYNRAHSMYSIYGGSGVTVHKDWHNYSKFKEWYDKNVPEGYHVDKDLLSGSSKVYSEETCCALPQHINVALTCGVSDKKSGLPDGVRKRNNRFRSQITIHGITRYLGTFNTPEEAHQVWRVAKIKYVQELAQESYSKGEITEKVYKALLEWAPPL